MRRLRVEGKARNFDRNHALMPGRIALFEDVSANPLDRHELSPHRLDEVTGAQILNPSLAIFRGNTRAAKEAMATAMRIACSDAPARMVVAVLRLSRRVRTAHRN